MKNALVLGLASAAVIATLSGCSSSPEATDATGASTPVPATTSGPAATTATGAATPAPATAQPGTGHVRLNNADLGAVTGVTCQTDAGTVTIRVESTPGATLVLTDEATPAVRSVTIGELGADGPSMAYVDGISGSANATRAGSTYTVSGTGTGAQPDAPETPVELPFEIAATCP